MKPGRELDALVAEKLMGWKRWECRPGSTVWIDENGRMKRAAEPSSVDFCSCEVFSPSTEISDAWEVVEKLHDSGFYFTIKSPPRAKSDSYWVSIDDFYGEKYYTAHGVTAPLTICLAALEAVGVKVE